MKLKSAFFLTAMIFVLLTNVNNGAYYETNKWDVFENLLQVTQGKVDQCEVKTRFQLQGDNGAEVCLDLLKELKCTKGIGASINIMKDDLNYSIQFQKGNISGYLQSNFYKDYNIITIDIQQKCEDNQLENIKNVIDSAIQIVNSNRHMELSNKQVFKFLMAKVPVADIHELNSKVIKLLEKHNSVNVNTIDINNGCSTVAYTRRGEYIINQGKKMDLNYAICKYSSGNYLVLGTPIIITSY